MFNKYMTGAGQHSLHSPAFLRAAARPPGLSEMSIQGCTAPLRFIRFTSCTYAHRVSKNHQIENLSGEKITKRFFSHFSYI